MKQSYVWKEEKNHQIVSTRDASASKNAFFSEKRNLILKLSQSKNFKTMLVIKCCKDFKTGLKIETRLKVYELRDSCIYTSVNGSILCPGPHYFKVEVPNQQVKLISCVLPCPHSTMTVNWQSLLMLNKFPFLPSLFNFWIQVFNL